jgi:hypothetical protein
MIEAIIGAVGFVLSFCICMICITFRNLLGPFRNRVHAT